MTTEIFDDDSGTPETEHFGFTRIGENEALSKNGWAALDLDRVSLDNVLWALLNAPRDGSVRLEDPTDEASASVAVGDGAIPGGTTLYYSYAFLDKWGLETAGSPEIEVITNDPIEGPSAAGYVVEVSGGTLVAGYYSYAITAITASGEETTADFQTDVRIDSGAANRIFLNLPDLPSGATAFRIYRARPGQEELYYLDESSSATYTDDGGVTEDTSITPPSFNDTNSSCSVEVELPDGVPVGCFGWRLYRTLESGIYDGYNLVHTVTEGVSELDSTPRDSWVDLGDGLLSGQPRSRSITVGGGASLGFGGTDPDDPNSSLDPGLLPRGTRSWDSYAHQCVVGEIIAQRTVTEDAIPIQMDVYFSGTAPATDADGAQAAFEVFDAAGNRVVCGTNGADAPGAHASFYATGVSRTLQAEIVAIDNGDVEVVSDEGAENGQAVEIDADNEVVDFELADFAPGRYTFQVRYSNQDDAPGPASDFTVQVVDTDDDTVYAAMTLTVPAGPAYALTEAVELELPSSAVAPAVRVTKQTATAAVYRVDQIVFTGYGTLEAGLLTVRTTLADPPGVDPLPALVIDGPRLSVDRRRIWAVSGIDTTVTVHLTAGVGVSWTATSDDASADPEASGSGDSDVTITMDYSGLSAGDRVVATVTFSAAAHDDAVLEVVALKAPAVMGSRANISVLY